MKSRWALSLLVVLASCRAEPAVRPQWTVTLRTDAPLPIVGDRVLVEITSADRTVASRLLDAGNVSAWPISFGIVESPSPLRIRARLYRTRATRAGGVPDTFTTIDAVATLPAAPGPVVVPLMMTCFGQGATADETCDPASGALAPIVVAAAGAGDDAVVPGSWRESRSEPCASAAPNGMVCVQGGLFFFGDDAPGVTRDQLVRVSSFFADADEFSVRRARELFGMNPALPAAPRHHTNDRAESSVCTYLGAQDGANDDQPLNCVTPADAAALCAADGKRMIREAEFAYAAGNGTRGSPYPWGDDPRICRHAVVARGALPQFSVFPAEIVTTHPDPQPTECRVRPGQTTLRFGPVARGVATLDVTIEPAGLRNLSGNLSEWVEDKYGRMGDDCWGRQPWLIDPVCRTGSDPTVRGAAWSYPTWLAGSKFRSAIGRESNPAPNLALNHIGFRCAKAAGP